MPSEEASPEIAARFPVAKTNRKTLRPQKAPPPPAQYSGPPAGGMPLEGPSGGSGPPGVPLSMLGLLDQGLGAPDPTYLAGRKKRRNAGLEPEAAAPPYAFSSRSPIGR